MNDTNNVYLIWVNTKKAVIEFLKVCPHCFKFHIKLNNFSIWIKDPQMPVQNLKLLMCCNQKTENASEELSSAIQFSNSNVFFGLFWNSPLIFYIEAHQIIEQTRNSWCCFILVNGLFDENQMNDTDNVHLIWVNIKKGWLKF